MKERPILFSAPMILAILDGRKTMTRRVIKGAPGIMLYPQVQDCGAPIPELIDAYKNAWLTACPFGQPGDKLWVREGYFNGAGPGCIEGMNYRADHPECNYIPWKSPIFMPRWASRITLEITAVRVERVQDITESDAWNEGIRTPNPAAGFMLRWEDLNFKRGYGWDANPWVWVISFKRVK